MNSPKLKKTFSCGLITLLICLSLTPVFGWQLTKENVDKKNCQKCSTLFLGYTPLDLSREKTIKLPEPLNDLPETFDWRNVDGENWNSPIRNQGQCGSCWAFGAMGALEAAVNLELNDSTVDLDLSEQYLVSCYPGHGCEQGGHAYYAWRWLDLHGGALLESCFPYEAWDIPCEEKCENWEELLVPLGDYWTARDSTDESIKQVILDNGPVVADMAVYDDLFKYRGGVYVHPQQPDESESDINHQPVIVGWNDNEGCWIVKNSWGNSWGEDTYDVTGERGWFRIRYGDCFIGTGIHGVSSNLLVGNDTGHPVLELQNPLDGWFYLFGSPSREVLFGRTKIVGSLTVMVDAWDVEIEDEEITGIDGVEFFVDDVSQYYDEEPPYEWSLSRHMGFHTLRVIAFDKAGNPSNQVTIDFLKIL